MSVYANKAGKVFDEWQKAQNDALPEYSQGMTPDLSLPPPQAAAPQQMTQQIPNYGGMAAGQSNSILDQLRQRASGGNAFGQQYASAAYDSVRRMGNRAALGAMEQLNSRGILNSSVTGDRVAQVVGDIEAQVLPSIIEKVYGINQQEFQNLMGIYNAYQQQEQMAFSRQQAEAKAKSDAENQRRAYLMSKWKAQGYADNDISIGLGVKPGEVYSDVLQQRLDREAREKEARLNRENAVRVAQINNAPRPPAERPKTPAQEFEDTIYTKLNRGQPLTPQEESYAQSKGWLGPKQTPRDYVKMALDMLAKDLKFTMEEDETKRDQMIAKTVEMLKRQYEGATAKPTTQPNTQPSTMSDEEIRRLLEG